MVLEIDFTDETGQVNEEQMKLVNDLIQSAAGYEQLNQSSELSITFVDNNRIQEINREYRQIDRPTDVISFALEEHGDDELEIVGGDMPRVLGDIIISIPKAVEQAAEYGHSFNRELGFLAVHGFLHLLGYDHMDEEEEKKMFSRQEAILQQFGLLR